MEQQVKLQISAEGIVALPHSLISRLDLRLGDEVLARVDGGKIVLHRMNHRRGPRSEPRPVGFGSGDFHLPDGWEAPMNDEDLDDFLGASASDVFRTVAGEGMA
jgi:hypothetical protein